MVSLQSCRSVTKTQSIFAYSVLHILSIQQSFHLETEWILMLIKTTPKAPFLSLPLMSFSSSALTP